MQIFKQMPNANSDLEKKKKTLSSIFQNSKTKSCQLRLLCSRFRINPKYFLHIDIFFVFMYNAPLLFCVSKKNFRYFFLLVFFKKTFSGIFFYLNSTKCNCGL